MTSVASPKYARPLVAATLIGLAYLLARPAAMTEHELAALARDFKFAATVLGDGPSVPGLSVRKVHPRYSHIASWISAVGAGVALADLDGDGLPNDACHVDPRSDSVTVRPVPGRSHPYEPLRLEAPAIPDSDITAPMGCLPGDMDEDGRLDLLVYFWGRTPVGFLQRGAPGTAGWYKPFEVVPGRERWYSNAAVFTDVDGDTHSDLIIGNYFPDGARVLDPSAQSDAWMQQSMSRAFNGGTKQIWRWRSAAGDAARFERIADAIPSEWLHGWTLAVGAADLDGDLLPEIFFANDFGPDLLLHNESRDGRVTLRPLHGQRTLTTPASKVLGRDSFKGMGVDFADVNGDGRLDFFVSNIAAQFALEESHQLFVSTGAVEKMREGIAPYVDHSESLGVSRSGWGWDARFADFDNDGTPELVQATGFMRGSVNRWPELHEIAMGNDTLLAHPGSWHRFQPGDDLNGHDANPFYVRRGEHFHDVAAFVGTAQRQVTRGLAVADVDHDGLLDYAAANQWEPSLFYRNERGRHGAFIGLNVLFASEAEAGTVHVASSAGKGPRGSPAFGAAVEIRVPDGRRWVSHVDGGSGHSGKRSPEVHVGLGSLAADTPITAVVSWRNGKEVERETLALRAGWHTVWLPRRGVASPTTFGGTR